MGNLVIKLQIDGNFDLFGDVTGHFAPADMFTFVPAAEIPA